MMGFSGAKSVSNPFCFPLPSKESLAGESRRCLGGGGGGGDSGGGGDDWIELHAGCEWIATGGWIELHIVDS